MAISCPTGCATKGIQVEDDIFNANLFEELVSHGNRLNVCCRIARSKAFYANLVELTQTASLRTLITEHGTDIIDLAWFLNFWCKEFIFNIGADHWCGSFRTQSDVAVSLIIEVIHLLGHDIRCIPYRTTNDLVMFKNRCADLCVIVFFKGFASKSFYILPLSGLLWQDILGSFWFL